MSTGQLHLLSGWGRATWSAAHVAAPTTQAELDTLVLEGLGPFGRFIPRGLGRAYGDAAQCAGGLVLDCRGLRSVLELDQERGEVRASAGISFDELLAFVVPRGYFLPVTPGTRFVTVGGAIASDVHGKNHHVDGSLGSHVQCLRLVAPTGVVECGPHDHREHFDATCGGMGLTGVITQATLRLVKVESSSMVVDTERAADLDACLSLLSTDSAKYRYSVAWVDSLARGRRLGRSVLTRANHARAAELPKRWQDKPLSYRAPHPLNLPLAAPFPLLNPATVSAFNEMWYRKAPKHRQTRLEPFATFFYPLDGIGNWNLLYGNRGFTQYQFVVPFGAEKALEMALEKLSGGRVGSFLAVLKSFGPAGEGLLSFPTEGWTLALDIPLGTAGLAQLLDELDTLVVGAGGRVYLSKDARVRRELIGAMYPRLGQWQALQAQLDPDGVLVSDLSLRLGLTRRPGPRAPQAIDAK
ncbi:MAG: FAD-binding oxidoreductase [Actinobacteria bacterium]|nr:FAD-binding oxidoreductase [Actinomycetota bacterium]